MSHEDKFFIPKSFQTPNALVDKVMPNIGGPAFKVLICITRWTLGWEEWRRGSGFKMSLGGLRKKTGLSRQSIIDAVRELSKLKLVVVKKAARNSRDPNEYALNLNLTTGELVHNLDQSKLQTSPTSPGIRPELVQNLDSLKYQRSKYQYGASRKKRERADTDPRVKTLIAAFSDKYLARVGSHPVITGKEAASLKRLLTVSDVPTVEAAMDGYFANDFYAKTGYDAAIFAKAFNRLNSAGAKKRRNYEDGAFPSL